MIASKHKSYLLNQETVNAMSYADRAYYRAGSFSSSRTQKTTLCLVWLPIFTHNVLLNVILVLPTSLICLCELAFGTEHRPNIVWLTCEDMSARLGCYGDSTVPTPNIDRLAQKGVLYTRCFGTYGVCAPNRHTLITGMYPTSTGAMAMRTMKRTAALKQISDSQLLDIPIYEATPAPEVRCFTEWMRMADYYCTNNSKTDYQFHAPVTTWDECGPDAHWRKRPNEKTPFFAVFNCDFTHESQIFRQTSPTLADPNGVPVPPYYPDNPVVRSDIARHYDNISKLDVWVGKRIRELEEAEQLENTIVFFFSDHGDGLPRMKRWVYDSGLHVPLIVMSPDSQGAGTSDGRLISFVDLAPTVLSLAGIPLPSYLQGHTFMGSNADQPRRYIYACRDRMDPAHERIRAVRDHRFKYIRNYEPNLPYLGYIPYRDNISTMKLIHQMMADGELGSNQWQFWAKTKPLEELYDTKADPHEIHNLASEPRYLDKLAELREAHLQWSKEHGDLGRFPESELVKLLWPPDGNQPTTELPEVHIQNGLAKITCDTNGASIGYRFDKQSAWKVYDGPFPVGKLNNFMVIAHRIGWKPSSVVRWNPGF